MLLVAVRKGLAFLESSEGEAWGLQSLAMGRMVQLRNSTSRRFSPGNEDECGKDSAPECLWSRWQAEWLDLSSGAWLPGASPSLSLGFLICSHLVPWGL